MPYEINADIPELFRVVDVNHHVDAILFGAQIAQAVRITDETMRGFVEGVGAPFADTPGRFTFPVPSDRAEVADAIYWLAMRGLLTFVNSDPNTVDLAP